MASKSKDQGEQQGVSTKDIPFIRPDPEPTVWIVNPVGALHEVTVAHARRRLSPSGDLYRPGFRRATEEEIEQLERQQGIQVSEYPIADPINDEDPLADLDLEG